MLLIPQDCMKIKLAVNYTRNGENLTETIDFYDLISYLSVGQNYRIERLSGLIRLHIGLLLLTI